jgi:hypothetical protein
MPQGKEAQRVDTLIGVGIFVVFIVGIWWSYRLFMRGDTYEEKVRRLLPEGFKPDLFHMKGDTYVGYEKDKDRLVLVDWPHGKALSAHDVVSLASVQESTLGVTHYWVAVNIADAAFPSYRIWFQFRRAKRDEWLGQLARICGK